LKIKTAINILYIIKFLVYFRVSLFSFGNEY